jgi:hypothetical protein
MVKTPDFDKRKRFGASSERAPVPTPETITITPQSIVMLRYKGSVVAVQVTKVVAPQAEFEGSIQDFDNQDSKHEDLAQGDEVRFRYEHIEHIYSTPERD